MIAIIDYDAGNTFNVQKAFAYIGLDAVLTADPEVILNADGVSLARCRRVCIGSSGSKRARLSRCTS